MGCSEEPLWMLLDGWFGEESHSVIEALPVYRSISRHDITSLPRLLSLRFLYLYG